MSNKKWFILIIIAVLCSWFARGLYDEFTFYSGYFHVINGTEKNKTIELTFPSGESRKTIIKSPSH